MDAINISSLPLEIRSKLAELDLELAEGDITEKGYAKKRARLLESFLDSKSELPPSDLQLAAPPEVSNLPTSHGHSGGALFINSSVRSSTILEEVNEYDSSSPVFQHQSPDSLRNKRNRRFTRDESRYRSDIREEAVKEALARIQEETRVSHALIPSRRESKRTPYHPTSESPPSLSENNAQFDSDSAEEEDSLIADTKYSDASQAILKPAVPPHGVQISSHTAASIWQPVKSSSMSSRERTDDAYSMPPPDVIGQVHSFRHHQHHPLPPLHPAESPATDLLKLTSVSPPERDEADEELERVLSSAEEPSDSIPLDEEMITAEDVSRDTSEETIHEDDVCAHPSPTTRANLTNKNADLADRSTSDSTSRTTPSLRSLRSTPALEDPGVSSRISEKIQQLVNTLKRPKRRPLSEYFVDDNDVLIAVPTLDPNAPKAKGDFIEPSIADNVQIPSGLPKDFVSALYHFSSIAGKSIFLSCLDATSKPTLSITYAKMQQRCLRIAYMLLNKLGHRGEESLKPRDRVALVFPNNDPISFVCAFYACIVAGVVPLPIEVPLYTRDASSQTMGFLLSCASVRVALTNDECFRALPRNAATGDVEKLQGWPQNLLWLNVDHHQYGGKVPKDWRPTDQRSPEDPLYIEYTFGRDGSVRGVTVTRQAALEHARALTVACHYCEGDVAVCVLDAKRETGLWHSVLASLLNGMHVIFVPYSVLKADPGSWLRMVSKYRATIAFVKSRDMHWAMLAEKEQSSCLLHTLRMLLVADGANPWSLNTCDAFLTQFRSNGLRSEAICPQAGSSECLTVALRRPPATPQSTSVGIPAPSGSPFNRIHSRSNNDSTNSNHGSPDHHVNSNLMTRAGGSRGILSMYNLSFGVVRVDAETSITSLTIQDSGTLLPGGTAVCVKPFGQPYLCRTDEVGEICISSKFCGSGYWSLTGLTNSYFKVTPLRENGNVAFPSISFVRSGLLGFLGPSTSNGNLIFVCGSMDGLILSTCRRHNADDIVSTVLAVEPMKLIYRGRTCIFSITLLKDERIVVVAELRPGFAPEVIYKWISRVMQAVDTIHQVSIYAVALVTHNTLPKTPLGGINVHETRRRFEQGCLHPCHLLLSPHSAITNLPEARNRSTSCIAAADPSGPQVGPSAMLVGSLVQGARLAIAEGPAHTVPRTPNDSSRYQYLTDILQWRAKNTPDERLYTLFNHKLQEASHLTCSQLHRKAEKIGSMLLEKGKIGPGAHVLLFYNSGVDLVCAVFGCLYAGCVPVPVKTPQQTTLPLSHSADIDLELLRQIGVSSGAALMLTHSVLIKFLKSKEVQKTFPWKSWPTVIDTDESYRKRLSTIYRGVHPEQETAYLDYSVSSSGLLYGSRYSHAAVYSTCQSQKLQCELYTGREVVLTLDPYTGLSFILWCLSPVFCGHHALLMATNDCVQAPSAWLTLLSQRRARDAFCSYLAIETCTKSLSLEISTLKSRGISLSDLRSLVVISEERPRVQTLNSFCKLFSTLCLHPGVVSTSFGCPVNAAIALRGASHPEATTLYVDKIALRNDRVKLVERGSPNSLGLMECGTLLPGVRVAIVHPETLGHLADCQLGEICVYSPHTATGFCAVEQSYGTYTRVANTPPTQTNSSGGGSSLLSSRPRFTPPLSANSRPASARSNNSQLHTASLLSSRLGPLPSSSSVDSPNSSIQGHSSSSIGAIQRDLHSRFHIHLQSGDTQTPYTRTGYMGFVKRLEYGGGSNGSMTVAPGETHDALFVVEEVDESLLLRGMRFYPIDLENTILRAHKTIADCAVFTWSGLLVAVVELEGNESDAQDVVAQVTARVLEEHFLIVGVAVIVDVATIPLNNAGKKQRLLLRDTFVSDRLDPIYVAYNM